MLTKATALALTLLVAPMTMASAASFAATAGAAEPMTEAAAKAAAKEMIKEQKLRGAHIDTVDSVGETYVVKVVSREGIPLRTWTFDAKTGALL